MATAGIWQMMKVIDQPTAEQQAKIDRCTRTGATLIGFIEPGMTAWIAGSRAQPPWPRLIAELNVASRCAARLW